MILVIDTDANVVVKECVLDPHRKSFIFDYYCFKKNAAIKISSVLSQ